MIISDSGSTYCRFKIVEKLITVMQSFQLLTVQYKGISNCLVKLYYRCIGLTGVYSQGRKVTYLSFYNTGLHNELQVVALDATHIEHTDKYNNHE